MTDLIGKIAAAIIRQEGNNPHSLNPGNLRAAPWKKNPIITDNFWKPASREEGIAGIYHVVALHIAKGESLTQLIYSWAPPSDNNPTAQYLVNVKKWTGIPDEHEALWKYQSLPEAA